MLTTWNRRDPTLHFAESLGVAIWIVVMVGLDEWLVRRGRGRASHALGLGALSFAGIQGILALISTAAVSVLYVPVMVILLAGLRAFFPIGSRFALNLALTMAAGVSVMVSVVLLAALFLRFGRRTTIDEASPHRA
jgi:hypothetical protein